jgi:ATP-dependent RNA helicase HrpB
MLPIYEIESEILAGLRGHRRLIVSAPTGSGKSTQVPQMLLDRPPGGRGQIVMLQPRRLAARLLAARVASERKTRLGGEVGYQIRFENVTGPETRIRFVTEGILLRQMVQDPGLRGVDTLIFDEFHERHLYGDITLARALDLQESSRPDLQIVVMSATLDLTALERYLDPCGSVEARGRSFPIEIEYAERPGYLDQRPVWEQAAAAFARVAPDPSTGDALIFMPGGYEISQTIQALRRAPEAKEFVLLPLHGELPPREQDAAVARYDRRKVVVATNVAETSLTIDGVRCVIDSGLARIPRYDPYRGINTLLVEKISRAAADQRAGRAGRTGPGRCLRLWSPEEHAHRPEHEVPEVKRLDLAEVVLTLKASGVGDLSRFRWLEPPPEAALSQAVDLLTDLGALSAPADSARAGGDPEITPLGRQMLSFPLHPRYARLLLAARDFDCVHDACLIAALTQGRDLLVRNVDANTARRREDLLPRGAASDFTLLMKAWEYAVDQQFEVEACRRMGIQAAAARQVGPLLDQFLEIARREGLDISARHSAEIALRKCALAGFSDRVARRVEGGSLRCELVHGRRGSLVRESVVQESPLLVVAEVREVEGKEKGVNTLLSLAAAIEEKWLHEMFPGDIGRTMRVFFDSGAKRVFAEEEARFRGLAISTRRVEPPPADEAARLLAEEVIAGRLTLNGWDETVEQWILRLNSLRQWCPELELPALENESRRDLIEQLCHGAFGYKEIKDRPVLGAVKGWLSGPQQALLEKHAPERLHLSNGRLQKLVYQAGASPHMAIRIQQLYGVNATPRIAMGRVPVLVHILAPNMRPVQITQDLAGFWREQYPRVKQELQRKYPRHEWR